MRNRIRTMVKLGLLFFLLLFVYLITGHRTETAALQQKEEMPEPLLSVPADAIRSISWNDGEQEVSVRRTGDSWSIDSYEGLRASKDQINALAEIIVKCTPLRRIGHEGSLSDYGLEKSRRSVCAELEDGRTVRFSIGNRLASGGYYVCDDAGSVYILSGELPGISSLSPADIAVKETVPLITDKRYMEIRAGNRELIAEKTGPVPGYTFSSHYQWFVKNEAETLPLDTVKLEAMVTAVRKIRFDSIEAFGADGETTAAYGLDDPDIRFVLRGNGTEYALLFNSAEGGYYYCMFEGSDMIYGTDSSVPELLEGAVNYAVLRPEDVYSLDWETVSSIEISLDGTTRRIGINADAGGKTYIDTENGAAFSSEKIEALRNYLDRIETSGQQDGDLTDSKELVRLVFHRDSQYDRDIELCFLEYQEDYALTRFHGETRQLVSMYAVEGVIQLCRDLLGMQAVTL